MELELTNAWILNNLILYGILSYQIMHYYYYRLLKL
jgi:hypothetical protein